MIPLRLGSRGVFIPSSIVSTAGASLRHVSDGETWVARAVFLVAAVVTSSLAERARLRAEEAEDHPRKNELQQAIGGAPFVEPGLYHTDVSVKLSSRAPWKLDVTPERIEIVAASGHATREHKRSLIRLIESTSFRPRIVDGQFGEPARVTVRYRLP